MTCESNITRMNELARLTLLEAGFVFFESSDLGPTFLQLLFPGCRCWCLGPPFFYTIFHSTFERKPLFKPKALMGLQSTISSSHTSKG